MLIIMNIMNNRDHKTGTSSLIIDDNEGLILTNKHLIRYASCVLFTLTDCRKYMAEIKGTD